MNTFKTDCVTEVLKYRHTHQKRHHQELVPLPPLIGLSPVPISSTESTPVQEEVTRASPLQTRSKSKKSHGEPSSYSHPSYTIEDAEEVDFGRYSERLQDKLDQKISARSMPAQNIMTRILTSHVITSRDDQPITDEVKKMFNELSIRTFTSDPISPLLHIADPNEQTSCDQLEKIAIHAYNMCQRNAMQALQQGVISGAAISKLKHQFIPSGSRLRESFSKRYPNLAITWPIYCSNVLYCSSDTAGRYINLFEFIRQYPAFLFTSTPLTYLYTPQNYKKMKSELQTHPEMYKELENRVKRVFDVRYCLLLLTCESLIMKKMLLILKLQIFLRLRNQMMRPRKKVKNKMFLIKNLSRQFACLYRIGVTTLLKTALSWYLTSLYHGRILSA